MKRLGEIVYLLTYCAGEVGVIMSEDVVFKGSRAGLQVVFDETVEFATVLRELKMKLETAIDFFGKGTTVSIAKNKITAEQQEELRLLFQSFGLRLKVNEINKPMIKEVEPLEKKVEFSNEVKIINQTVRGGQEITSHGSIVILGNVNPGAKIIAGGNIDVKGACRGIVHAGAFGDRAATIVADKMLAMQICIADIIARAPDNLESTGMTECASIKHGNIVIEPINRQEVG